ncbi:MAG TPA: hypothetical protein VEI97_03725 [bacterium]|nr:hypothetical protein [bacterium]
MTAGTKVKWQGQDATVLGGVPGFESLLKIQLANGEAKEVHKSSVQVASTLSAANLHPSVKRVIEAVRDATAAGQGATVAALLRALPGPDTNNEAVKNRTISKIRAAIFGEQVGGIFGSTNTQPFTKEDLDAAQQVSPHFAERVRKAAQALGFRG